MGGRLLIVFDATGNIDMPYLSDRHYDPNRARGSTGEPAGSACAVLDTGDDLKGKDIYALARKLAEMLLEQL